MKLRQRGVQIEPTRLREISQELGIESELETARRLVQRKYVDASLDRKVAMRAVQMLLRRGFSSNVARKAVFCAE